MMSRDRHEALRDDVVASWSDVAHIYKKNKNFLLLFLVDVTHYAHFLSHFLSIAVETQIQLSLLALAILDFGDLSLYFSW